MDENLEESQRIDFYLKNINYFLEKKILRNNKDNVFESLLRFILKASYWNEYSKSPTPDNYIIKTVLEYYSIYLKFIYNNNIKKYLPFRIYNVIGGGINIEIGYNFELDLDLLNCGGHYELHNYSLVIINRNISKVGYCYNKYDFIELLYILYNKKTNYSF